MPEDALYEHNINALYIIQYYHDLVNITLSNLLGQQLIM